MRVDHIVSVKDTTFGIAGHNDALMIKYVFSDCKFAYPMPDKSSASTMEAIMQFKGDRITQILYSDGSGEIDKALRELRITPEKSQPGVPPNSAVAERAVQDVLYGTRAVLVRVGLPLCFGEFAIQHYWLMGNAMPMGQSAEVDASVDIIWKIDAWRRVPCKMVAIPTQRICLQPDTKRVGKHTKDAPPTAGIFCRLRNGTWAPVGWDISCLVSRRICRIRFDHTTMPASEETQTRKP